MGIIKNNQVVYNLKETALRICVSTTHINRIQRKLGFPRPIGKRGQRSYFTLKEIKVLQRIKILRILGYEYEEIRQYEKTNFIVEDDKFLLARGSLLSAQLEECVFKKHTKTEMNNGLLHSDEVQ